MFLSVFQGFRRGKTSLVCGVLFLGFNLNRKERKITVGCKKELWAQNCKSQKVHHPLGILNPQQQNARIHAVAGVTTIFQHEE